MQFNFNTGKVMEKKVILIILDGWGQTQNPEVSAIYKADTPFFDSLIAEYSNASLRTDGLHVGLPEGQMGNSEVGHMNLGAGRIVYQDFVKINNAVEDGSLAEQKVLVDAFPMQKTTTKKSIFSDFSQTEGFTLISRISKACWTLPIILV